MKKLTRIKQHLKKVFPQARNIEVKIDKTPKNEFKSTIRLQAPHKREVVATKKDIDYNKALKKSHGAIIRQLHKIKTEWEKKTRAGHDIHPVSEEVQFQ